jgi:hypothetical protein
MGIHMEVILMISETNQKAFDADKAKAFSDKLDFRIAK